MSNLKSYSKITQFKSFNPNIILGCTRIEIFDLREEFEEIISNNYKYGIDFEFIHKSFKSKQV